ncbi:MAG: rfbD [Solirubrobacterales bacterium]|nr:rfbD [Solirubrobacterales bacterium]
MTGAAGMLGHRVVDAGRAAGHDVVAADLAECDLTDADAVTAFVAQLAPDAIVNCAAYTDVDAAEEHEDVALRVNADAAGNLARAAAAVGARLVHVSTDYVFDGENDRPWVESDHPSPLGAYGRTKLAGEEQVALATPDHAIVRTAWLFGVGGPNFVDTMLRLAQDRDEVAVVTDQTGCPTWAGHLAPALVALAEDREQTGVFHGAGGGQCTWNELAAETFSRAGVACRATPTTADAFKRPAPRPAWSVLGTQREPGVRLPPWTQGLQGHLDDLKEIS